jgi:hypothetical protein
MANFTTATPYQVKLGNQTISFPNAYVQTQLTSTFVANLPYGLTLDVTVWDSAASAAPNSGVNPIDNPQFPITVTPALAAAVLAALISEGTNPTLSAFAANLIPTT